MVADVGWICGIQGKGNLLYFGAMNVSMVA
jgi:hypothetical protein